MADIEPRWHDGIPFCSDAACPSYDGKRCEVLGMRPGNICEPAVSTIASRNFARGLEAAAAHVEALADSDVYGGSKEQAGLYLAALEIRALKPAPAGERKAVSTIQEVPDEAE